MPIHNFVLNTTRETRLPVSCRRTLKAELCYLPQVRSMICFNVKVETGGRRRKRRTTNCDKLKISRSSRRSLRGNITLHLEEMNQLRVSQNRDK